MPNNSNKDVLKTGIFGGAFNPVHNGHVNLAREAAAQLKLRRLIIIPTFEPPHKENKLLPFDDRAEMCRMAFSDISEKCPKCAVEVSDIERRMGGVSYTINTLRELKREFPKEQFFLLIGGDSLFSFDKWFKYESILNECKVCALARGGDSLAEMMEFAAEMGRVKVLPSNVVDISSTEIREKLRNSGDISGLVPNSVAEYIYEHKFFTEEGAL